MFGVLVEIRSGPFQHSNNARQGRCLHEDAKYQTTSASLLVRVRDPADEHSWREFEARYGDLVLGYCRNRGLQPADAEDVRQAVWINLSKGLRNFEYDPARGRFRSYLGRAVRNAISRHFARYASADGALDTGVLASVPGGDSEADEVWEQEWVNHHYRLAIRTIESTFEVRSVSIFTRLLAGEKASDLAVEYGVSAAAINQVKHRIRERMKELIAAQIREEDDPETYGELRTDSCLGRRRSGAPRPGVAGGNAARVWFRPAARRLDGAS